MRYRVHRFDFRRTRDQAKLELDADVNTYLDSQIPATLRLAQGDAPAEPITLIHLLTHTPGFEPWHCQREGLR